jgi:NADPH-dependent 2,4-dienoyl-CoA reductase/sulfur reductase-like enzyme
MDCVIVGGGAGGFQAAFACLDCWPEKSVTLIDAEQEVGYYRPLLPQFMVGTITEEKLFFWRPESEEKLTVRTGVSVTSVDRETQRLHLDTGEAIEYERLILACGGRPIIPAICPDPSCKGVFPVRYLTTARAIKTWLPGHPNAVVLGGGLVGVKTAAHLAHAGLGVTIIEKEDDLLPQALSSHAARFVQQHLEEMGIDIILGCSVEDVKIADGHLRAVQASGRWLTCETLLIAAGSTPDISFLGGSGLLNKGRLEVASDLRTLDENIFAVGDAVAIRLADVCTPWTWPQAVSQGKLAATNLYRSNPVPLKAHSRVNAMNLFGLSLAILGAPTPGAERISRAKPEDQMVRELYVKDDRIVGGAFVGDISGAGIHHASMITGGKINKRDPDLLKPHGNTFPGRSWHDLNQNRRAWLIPENGSVL